ncbi:Methanethiol oxidase [Hyphomicrobium sp. 1Nfss2.1]|uniref:selenium-binding protein SBP56-related protein n=1 Tax=Hyphomicrobium sp. 1Nfss2.1 TaxID=3413936 RepID=UPI003C79C124
MLGACAAALSLATIAIPAVADETCNSPFTAALITGQEQFLHVWTLGEVGVGDESDKLVTIDVEPSSANYGKVINSLSVGGRGEAHHVGFTDDRRYIWAGRLDDNKIFVFDLVDPAKPKVVKVIEDFSDKTGYVGPHTFYAMPGRMMVQALSNNKTHDGKTGIAIYNNAGELISTHDMPLANGGDGYGYDIGINPNKNVMLTSSFTGWTNYMMDMGKMVKDPDAMKNFGNTMVIWDLKSMEPKKVLSVPGAPLEIRWSLKPEDNWALTATALTSKLWLVKQDDKGEWVSKEVGTIGDPAKIPLPVDISIAADAKTLWVNTFMDGTTRLFDVSNPEEAKEIYSKKIGNQVNMVSQSYDGKRVYFTTSLLANWDKKGEHNDQFLKAYDWDGKDLVEKFTIDFNELKLGRAHHMKFSAKTKAAKLGD